MKRTARPTSLRVDSSLLSLPFGGSAIMTHAFACMGIAEEEIERAKLTRPQGSRAFAAAAPSAALASKSLELYRAHVRELCARARAARALAPGTDAECLAAIADTSLIAPLESNAAAAYERLFSRVFPNRVPASEPAGRERWAGAVEEVIAALRKKTTVNTRDNPEKE